MTLTQASGHCEHACRATVVIFMCFILGFMIEYFVSDREVDDE
jgi:hypothetical protein